MVAAWNGTDGRNGRTDGRAPLCFRHSRGLLKSPWITKLPLLVLQSGPQLSAARPSLGDAEREIALT